MAVRVLLNRVVGNFETHYEYYDNIFESNDGMRPGRSILAKECNTYSFSNEEKVENGFWYDLEVKRETSSFRISRENLTKNEESFKKFFDKIVRDLGNRGIKLLNYSSVIWANSMLDSHDYGENLDILFIMPIGGESFLGKDNKKEVYDLSEILSYLGEKDERANILKFYRTIGDFGYLNGGFYVRTESLTEEFLNYKQKITLKREDISGFFKDEKFREEVMSYLQGRIDEYEESNDYYHDNKFSHIITDDIEDFILSLPEEFRRKVFLISKQTPKNLLLRRQYAEDCIDWKIIKEREMISSDVELFAKYRPHIGGSDWLRSLVLQFMQDPEREKKVIQNAWTICREFQEIIAKNLKVCSHLDHLRGVIADAKRSGKIGSLDDLNGLYGYNYEGISLSDFEDLRRFFKNDSRRSSIFLVELALAAGLSENAVVDLIMEIEQEDDRYRYNSYLFESYIKYDFAPGLQWIKELEELEEANRQEAMRARATENQKTVDYVKSSGKLSVRVRAGYDEGDSQDYLIKSVNREYLGLLLSSEKRVLLMEGRQFDYLINVERVQRLRNGVLHLDILEVDAGAIIGRGGSNLKEAVETLNRLGCSLRTIKVHRHSEEEGVV